MNVNFTRLKDIDPDLFEIVEASSSNRWSLAKDPSGSLNLMDSKTKEFLHAQEGPQKEADRWASSINLKEVKTLFVYGIGLGYYYEPLKDWLKEKDNFLIFIEDEGEIIRRFLEGDRAAEILKNPQVRILKIPEKGESWKKFDSIMLQFSVHPYQITAIMSYLMNKVDRLSRLNMMIEYTINTHKLVQYEHKTLGILFYRNFFSNLLKFPESKVGSFFFDKFKGKPAIICGAGPSLKKNIELLATLKDKALIIAGGTAINALNAGGINPHIGFGLDPNEDHSLRILTNEAFMVPFFYNSRMYHTALNLIHGDLYYQNTVKNYPITYWMEKKLSIPDVPIESGYNVVNTCFALAKAFGCSPIITVGTDLAYSEEASYAPIVASHPIAEGSLKFVTKTEAEELIPRVDIYGKPTLTLWKWLIESAWYSKFVIDHPECVVINATEGGIGFPGVNNMPLKEVEEVFLKADYDFDGIIHALSQTSNMPHKITRDSILNTLKEATEGLDWICTFSKNIQNELILISEKGTVVDVDSFVADKLQQLQKEEAYFAFVEIFKHYSELIDKEVMSLEINKDVLEPSELSSRKARLQAARFELLFNAASLNLSFIKKTIEHLEVLPTDEIKKNVPQNVSLESIFSDETEPEGNRQVEEIPGTKIRLEYYKQNDLLHGPSLIYSEKGEVLSKSWYRLGKKHGLSSFYFEGGKPASYRGYNEGRPHGEHLYFYEDGLLRARIGYDFGILNGKMELYYPDGLLKRVVEYKNGLKISEEALYTENGERIIEAHYADGKPIGSARYFSPKGDVLKEVVYEKPGVMSHILSPGADGKLVKVDLKQNRDYFDSITFQIEKVTAGLSSVFKNVKEVLEIIKTDEAFIKGHEDLISALNMDLAVTGKELTKLSEFGQELIRESGAFEAQEPIWKTPAKRKMLSDKVTLLQITAQKGIDIIRQSINLLVSAYTDFNQKNPKK